jgi:hypothetical protein
MGPYHTMGDWVLPRNIDLRLPPLQMSARLSRPVIKEPVRSRERARQHFDPYPSAFCDERVSGSDRTLPRTTIRAPRKYHYSQEPGGVGAARAAAVWP